MPPKKRKSSAPKPTPPAKTSKRSTRHASTIISQTIADPSMSIQPVSQINTDFNPTTQPVSSASNPLIDYDQLAAAILRQQQQAMPSTSNPPIADTQLQASSSSNSSIDLNNANLLNNLQQLFSGPPSSQKCLSDVNNFENLCQRLGVPLKQSKTILPTTCLAIYGIEVDSVHMISRLPEDKLVNLRQLLAKTVHRRKVHLKELQSLIGSLNFACQVVTPGRAFLRRLIDSTYLTHLRK
eukprot:XP_019924812.1 PREDICTED: uncharacterized protein LOC105333150 [Crassostrea gigas]